MISRYENGVQAEDRGELPNGKVHLSIQAVVFRGTVNPDAGLRVAMLKQGRRAMVDARHGKTVSDKSISSVRVGETVRPRECRCNERHAWSD